MTNLQPKAITALILTLILGLGFCLRADTSPYVPPNIFVPNTLVQSSQVNANFSQAASIINNLDNSNIQNNAAIDPNKLSHVIAFPLLLMTNGSTVTFSIGQSGDTFPRIEFVSDGSLRYGPGAGVNVDVGLYRSGVGTLAVRNGTNAADAALTSGTLVLSTPLGAASGGTGLATITSGSYMKGNGVGAVSLQAAPIPLTDGGTGATVLAGHGAAILNAGGTALTSVAPGAANNALVSNGTDWVSTSLPAAGGVTFGGNGSDGAVTQGTQTIAGGLQYIKNATTFTQTLATTLSMSTGVCLIYCTSTATINGTINSISTAWPGGTGVAAASTDGVNGYGGGGGMRGTTALISGGGGGGGVMADGGFGGAFTTTSGQIGRSTYGPSVLVGSGGGSGGTGAGGTAGVGGFGSNVIRICAVGTIAMGASGLLSTKGGAAGAGATLNGGSGGGGAGTVGIYSLTSITTAGGSLNADGGAASNGNGAGGDGGGGGGAGLIVMMAPSVAAVTTSVAAGALGTGTVNGTAGGTGSALTFTGTPSYPLVAMHSDGRGLVAYANLARARNIYHGMSSTEIHADSREHCQMLAAWYAKPDQFGNLCKALMHGGGVEVAQYACVDVSKAFESAAGAKNIFPSIPQQTEQTAIGDFEAAQGGT